MAKKEPKIVKKIFKKAGHGHHGGAWKIAYADFVTAMMAFFLLMWLISSVTEEQKQGIADYFAPSVMNLESRAGNNGPLAGQHVMGENNSDLKGLGNNDNRNDAKKKTQNTFFSRNKKEEESQKTKDKAEQAISEPAPTSKLNAEQSKEETQLFRDIESKINRSIDAAADLKRFTTNILFETTHEGLNIIITDQEDRPMFPAGSYQMYDYMRNILAQIVSIIKELPNQIAITGHTDSVQYANTKNYTNWELSADRANATRRALVELGIDRHRFSYVKGRESRAPYDVASTTSVVNRRVEIILLHHKNE